MQGLSDHIGDAQVFLSEESDLVQLWYNGAFVLALAIALFAVCWIFYDSARKLREATIWKVISVVSVILAIPSAILWLYPSLADPTAATSIYGAVDALAFLGILGGIGGIVSLVCYALGLGEPALTCPTCGRPQDPSWEYCPYCEVPEPPTPVEPFTEPQPVSPTETLEPEGVAAPVGARLDETRVLRPKELTRLAYLVQTSGLRRGSTYPLGERTDIGRDAADNDIVLDDDAVSRIHARIRLEEGQFVLQDRASRNGTELNGKKILKQALVEGDILKIGETTFAFTEIKENEEA
jgi:hypothetical protein